MIEYEYYHSFQFLHYRLRPETQKRFLSDVLQEIDARSSLFKLFVSSGSRKILDISEFFLEEFEIF